MSSTMNALAPASRPSASALGSARMRRSTTQCVRPGRAHRVGDEVPGLAGHEHVRERGVGADAVEVAAGDVLDRLADGLGPSSGDALPDRLVAHPVAAELVPLEPVVVVVAERAGVQVPEVVHVDVVLDEELPVAPGIELVAGHLDQQLGPVAADGPGHLAQPVDQRSRPRDRGARRPARPRCRPTPAAGPSRRGRGRGTARAGARCAARRRARSSRSGTGTRALSGCDPQPSTSGMPRWRQRLWNARSSPSRSRTTTSGSRPAV